jgi:predicted ATP-binding protein involved in virulence
MNISKISLKNYRKFEEIDIEFDKKLSVLIGKNGTGKTSILEALTVAAGTFFFSIDGISSIGIQAADAYNKYFSIGEDIDVQKQFPVEITAKGSIEGKEIEWKRSLNSLKGKTTSVDAKDMIAISTSCQERLMKGDVSLKLPLVAYYGTGRLWDDHREKWAGIYKQNTRINGYIDCLDGRANVKLLLDWFK